MEREKKTNRQKKHVDSLHNKVKTKIQTPTGEMRERQKQQRGEDTWTGVAQNRRDFNLE